MWVVMVLISKAIRKRMEELSSGISGYELSMKAGIDRSIVSKFMTGKQNTITIETLLLLCQAFDIELKEFFDSPVFIDVEAYED